MKFQKETMKTFLFSQILMIDVFVSIMSICENRKGSELKSQGSQLEVNTLFFKELHFFISVFLEFHLFQ